MKQGYYQIPRRTFLTGVGASLAIPTLEIMGKAANEAGAEPPLRLGVLHKGNGVEQKFWKCQGSEKDFTLSPNTKPLERHKQDIIAFSNVGITSCSHYGAMSLFMTGKATAGQRPGHTFDQVIADQIGNETQFKSFHLSSDPVDVRNSTLNNLAHDQSGRPLHVERNARFAFDRLFRGLGDKKVRQEMSSVLDAVKDPMSSLLKKGSNLDREVLSDYLDSVRDVEKSIEKQEKLKARPNIDQVTDEFVSVEDIPTTMDTMSQLMALAFWTDSTRVMTYNLAQESSRRIHDFLGLKIDYHGGSHYAKEQERSREFNIANNWYMAQVAALIDKLKSLKEVNGGTVFDHSVLVFGSGLGSGNTHDGRDLPYLLAGGKGCGLNTGSFLHYEKGVPNANLLLSLIQHFGVETDKYSASTGTIDRLGIT